MKKIKNQTVSASITDPLANLSVIGMFQVAEDAVTELLGEMKLDNITIKERNNAVWVFTKSRIKKLKDIPWNEEFQTVCFISSVTHVMVNLDIAIRNASGELCVYSRLELGVFDLQKKRIKRLSDLGIHDRMVAEKPEEDIAFIRFNNEELPEKGKVQVKYTNVDFSKHTNNIEYIRFILNTYSVQELEEKPIKEMQVSFLDQTFENDILTIYKGNFGERDIFTLQKEDKAVVRSEIIF